ncbi:MAG TPA: hypothetical protein VFE10_08915 [Phenylobacterium sp.]|jgi:hypothetical protein|nr:hypothetical protein [Phenylobacterium sp.]
MGRLLRWASPGRCDRQGFGGGLEELLHRFKLALVAAFLVAWGDAAMAQSEEKEPAAVVEVGASAERGLKDSKTSWTPNLAVEITPIDDVLELEAGINPQVRHGRPEWEADFLFKKPWTLSKTVEFMAGVGPSWSHVVENGKTKDTMGAEAVLDFMFWPRPKSRFGWFLEPSYGYSFARGDQQSLAVSAGLLIKIP